MTSIDDHLTINEVGLRDGLQNQAVMVSCQDKVRLATLLVAAGLTHIEATSFVSPKAVPQMADANELFALLPEPQRIRYSALVPNPRGLARAMASGAQEIAVVLSATETMNQRNINMSLAQAKSVSIETVCSARNHGLRAKAYLAVAFECPFEGPVAAGHVLELAQSLMEAGADELVIADTIGAAAPRAVADMSCRCVSAFGNERVSMHLHDTRGFALANAWAAIQAGVRKFDSSLGGLGGCPFAPGAAGNLATEDLVLMAGQCGMRTGISMTALRQAIALAEELTQKKLGGRSSAWLDKQATR